MKPDLRRSFSGAYAGKTVLVTGHTGFKGSWLCTWLDLLGARVVGYSLEPPSSPAMFDLVDLGKSVDDVRGDVRDAASLTECVRRSQPDYVFHLAAQSLVRRSYEDPLGTYATNVMGIVNLLEVLRQLTRKVVVVNVTSDKCYLNQEWVYSYRESDALGGYDPYSSSKACSEILTEAFRRSFFPAERYGVTHQVSLASGRAGNVIGGGDWAMDRLIPDCVRSVTRGEPIIIRSPDAIRPWQHVLEPLAGYLWLGVAMASQPQRISGGWNFGPLDSSVVTVRRVVEAFISYWGSGKYDVSAGEHLHEAGLLKLDISKAIHQLEWRPVLKFDEAIQWTTAWYRQFHDGESKTLAGFTRNQIQEYTESARLQSVAWAGG